MLGDTRLTETFAEQFTTAPGMAHWASTGPVGKHCGDCVFKNYQYVVRNHAGLIVKAPKSKGCRKFHMLAGVHGPAIDGKLRACKYFEEKPAKK
jgi:hypothetical protein